MSKSLQFRRLMAGFCQFRTSKQWSYPFNSGTLLNQSPLFRMRTITAFRFTASRTRWKL